ncbi:MAG TPA: circularly permuted type 2 ATP-grasp protein [Bryobacteraceae bacterium]|nr:circularly permuted type 2 ATP-grasp protein [Bryobacteraceae bacterium]HOQ46080.1 circularly permuted type 2 ATP-grasp protein [Bryobacteraceae bacterium]HPU72809.1 circularly permuted type 2 ATP-grasp protein [Bryobacteraceae bacterium]
MSQLDEAVARFQKLLESEPYKDLGWAEALAERMQAEHLTQGGRLICPFLRPNFITRRQYATIVKAAEALFSAIDRVKQMALANPALLARMELLPAEKMLASIDPGYPFLAVTSLLGTHLTNGSLYFVEYNADTPIGVAYGEALADLFYEAPPVKEFRKRYNLQKLGGKKHLLAALLKAYKQFGGKKSPNIAILEFRQPFHSGAQGEYLLLREYFRSEGYPTEIVTPDQLDYRRGVLRRGNFEIDLVYRRVKAQEFLLRYDLSHPLVRAYREGKTCVVNSFRSELAHKKAIFDLLTDDSITASFPVAERKAIQQYIPWTRVVSATKTTYQGQTIDLPEFVLKNREKLVLKPNDDSGEHHSIRGWESDDASWERALKRAMRTPYVVQEKVQANYEPFPLLRYGEVEVREMQVDLHPHAYLGKVQSCSSWLSARNGGGFSSVSGLAPTFILEPKRSASANS